MFKRSFSLLELLVVIFLLALISTVVGIKITASIRERNFQENFKLLNDKVTLVKKLAKITQGGITLILEKKDGSIFASLDGEAIPTSQLKRALLVKQSLSGISNILLSDSQNNVCELPIMLTFYQNGFCYMHSAVDPKVKLEVFPAYSNLQSRFIEVSTPADAAVLKEGQDLYPLSQEVVK